MQQPEPDAVINPRAFMSFALDMHIEELEAISDDELQDLAHDEMVRLEAPKRRNRRLRGAVTL